MRHRPFHAAKLVDESYGTQHKRRLSLSGCRGRAPPIVFGCGVIDMIDTGQAIESVFLDIGSLADRDMLSRELR